jgi:acyl-CoA thioester hydrolase
VARDPAEPSDFRVTFRDVDSNGQMFRSVYVDWAEEAVADFWRRHTTSAQDPDFVVGKVTATFHRPLQLDDKVRMEVSVSKIGGKSAGFLVRMSLGEEPVAEVEVVWLASNRASGEPVALPEDLRDWLYKFLD